MSAVVLWSVPAGQAQPLSGPAVFVHSALGSVRIDRSGCANCGTTPESVPRVDAVIGAACGDTLRFVSTEPGATLMASVGKIAEANGPGSGMEMPLEALTGRFRVTGYEFVPLAMDWMVRNFVLKVRVRGCRKPRPEDVPSLPDPRGWPAVRLTSPGSVVQALLVSACATSGNCYRGEPPAQSLQVPTLDVHCGNRYAVTVTGVSSATVNEIAYPPAGGGVGVRATFPTAGDLADTKRLRFEVRAASMPHGVYVVDLNVIPCATPPPVELEDLPGVGEKVAPALPLHTTSRTPLPGQQAIAYSYPAAAGGKLVSSKGIYLGRLRWPDWDSEIRRSWDVVGIGPAAPRADACNFGGSGSTAVLADGTVLGALGRRGNAGYPDGRGIRAPDNAEHFTYLLDRLRQRTALYVPYLRFVTVCAYSVPPADTADQVERLVSPFVTMP